MCLEPQVRHLSHWLVWTEGVPVYSLCPGRAALTGRLGEGVSPVVPIALLLARAHFGVSAAVISCFPGVSVASKEQVEGAI